MTASVRLQLSRAKGFNLQAASRALNGLPAVVVARPGRLGNPFNWQVLARPATVNGRHVQLSPSEARRTAVMLYQMMIEQRSVAPGWEEAVDRYYRGEPVPSIGEIANRLKGANAACWCGAGDHCHADLHLSWTSRWWSMQ